jgi:ribosomal protein S2
MPDINQRWLGGTLTDLGDDPPADQRNPVEVERRIDAGDFPQFAQKGTPDLAAGCRKVSTAASGGLKTTRRLA